TVVFVETAEQSLLYSRDRAIDWAAARLTAQHALASAAIPIIFPTVRVAGRMYSDGSLRQNTPISPALRLGAGRVLVIALRGRRAASGRRPLHPSLAGSGRAGRARARAARGARAPLGSGRVSAAASRRSGGRRRSIRHAQLSALRHRVRERIDRAGRARRGTA